MNGWNFASIWESVADAQPDRAALIHGNETITWNSFERRSNNLAHHLLKSGCTHQGAVAFYLYNDPVYLELFFACSKASLVHVNTNYRYGPDELVYLWQNADAEAVVFHGSFTTTVSEVRPRTSGVHTWIWVDDDTEPCPPWAIPYTDAVAGGPHERAVGDRGRSGDDLVLLYTGGTTGMPKGVMWRQDDLFVVTDAKNKVPLPVLPDFDANGLSPAAMARVEERAGPVSIPACPLMHGTGLFNALTTVSLGGAIVTMTNRKLDIAEIFSAVERHKVKSIFIVGDAFAKPMLEALDSQPDRWDISSLRVLISSGVMWSSSSKSGLMAHNPKLLCVDTYGSSEAIGIGSSVSSKDGSAKTASFSLSKKSAVITEDGRIVQPGSTEIGRVGVAGRVPLGYFKDPEKTAVTFPTIDGVRYSVPGDFATVEADGTITLLGRGSVCINTGGEKVFPEEVEEALKSHPAVSDAIVVGIPDDRFGQRVAAVVAGPNPPAEAELISFVKSQLAHYKAPRHVLAVPSLERAANGKVDYKHWTRFAERYLSQAPEN
ncbi:MAG: AMP-binding protein [Acidimicrobiales bacterium]|nr:AMP-binding protein [Acidimicrobiales bacterium]